MAKSDFICNNCKKVVSKGFFRIKNFYKYSCPSCGVSCEDCVKTSIIKKPKCKKCGKTVLRYVYLDDKWQQC